MPKDDFIIEMYNMTSHKRTELDPESWSIWRRFEIQNGGRRNRDKVQQASTPLIGLDVHRL
jgi:hypothetical protein